MLLTRHEGGGTVLDAEPTTLACYRVNLFVLAIGPVHHGVDLRRGTSNVFGITKKAHAGRLDVDIRFTQTQKVEIQLSNLRAELDQAEYEDRRERRLDNVYQSSFRVVTYRNVGDSTMSHAVMPRKSDPSSPSKLLTR